MALNDIAIKLGTFAFIFILFFFGLYALIPNNFAVVSQASPNAEEQVPPTWHGIDLLAYNLSAAKSILLNDTNPDFYDAFTIGGRNLRLYSGKTVGGIHYVQLFHMYGLFTGWREAMDWYNRNNQEVSWQSAEGGGGPLGTAATIGDNEVDADFSSFNSMRFDVVCLGLGAGSSYFRVLALFEFNTTTYDTPSEAWTNNALNILIGITVDWEATGMNIWSLIGSLLGFQTIQVFGDSGSAAIGLNFMISGLIWAAIIIFAAVFTFELIQTIKPFG